MTKRSDLIGMDCAYYLLLSNLTMKRPPVTTKLLTYLTYTYTTWQTKITCIPLTKKIHKTKQRSRQQLNLFGDSMFGLEWFHHYACGRHVTIETDRKPMESISRKHLTHAPPRLIRMLLCLHKYDFTMKYVPGKDMLAISTIWIASADTHFQHEHGPFLRNIRCHSGQRMVQCIRQSCDHGWQ